MKNSFTDKDIDILIMDYVDGDDLLQKIENHTPTGFLDENQILLWTQQILEALEYLHLQDPFFKYTNNLPRICHDDNIKIK